MLCLLGVYLFLYPTSPPLGVCGLFMHSDWASIGSFEPECMRMQCTISSMKVGPYTVGTPTNQQKKARPGRSKQSKGERNFARSKFCFAAQPASNSGAHSVWTGDQDSSSRSAHCSTADAHRLALCSYTARPASAFQRKASQPQSARPQTHARAPQRVGERDTHAGLLADIHTVCSA